MNILVTRVAPETKAINRDYKGCAILKYYTICCVGFDLENVLTISAVNNEKITINNKLCVGEYHVLIFASVDVCNILKPFFLI